MLFALSSFKKMPVIKDATKIKTDSSEQSSKTIPQITFSEIAHLSLNEISNLIVCKVKKSFSSIYDERNEYSNFWRGMYYFPQATNCDFGNTKIIYIGGFLAEDDIQPLNMKILPDYNPYYRSFLIANDFEKLRRIQYKETISRITYYH